MQDIRDTCAYDNELELAILPKCIIMVSPTPLSWLLMPSARIAGILLLPMSQFEDLNVFLVALLWALPWPRVSQESLEIFHIFKKDF